MSSASDTATETRGMRMRKSPTDTRPFQGPLYGLDDPRRRRVDLSFEPCGRRSGDEPCADALDRSRKLAEALRLQRRHDFSAGTGELDRVMHHHGPAGAPH